MTSLTLEMAVQHARAIEAVSKEAGMFHTADLHEAKRDRSNVNESACFRCGRVGHDTEACWHVRWQVPQKGAFGSDVSEESI